MSVALAGEIGARIGTSPGWLLFGQGPERLRDLAEGEAVGEREAGYCEGRRHRFPLVGRVSASSDPEVLWEAVEPTEQCELPEGVVAMRVRGSSMQPVAYDGQHVLAVELPLRNGDLAAVELRDGRQFFKRWWWREGRKVAELVSVTGERIEPPVPIRVKQIRRAWRIVGVLF